MEKIERLLFNDEDYIKLQDVFRLIKNFRDPKLSLKKCKRIRRLLKAQIIGD